MLHQGLAYRSFKQTFNLADHVRVTKANLEHGLLSVELERAIPEQLRPRRIEVGVRPPPPWVKIVSPGWPSKAKLPDLKFH